MDRRGEDVSRTTKQRVHIVLRDGTLLQKSTPSATEPVYRQSSGSRNVVEVDDIDNIGVTPGSTSNFQAGYDAAIERMKRNMERCGILYSLLNDSVTADAPAQYKDNELYKPAPENRGNASEGLRRATTPNIEAPMLAPPDAPLFGVLSDRIGDGGRGRKAIANVQDITAFQPEFFNPALEGEPSYLSPRRTEPDAFDRKHAYLGVPGI